MIRFISVIVASLCLISCGNIMHDLRQQIPVAAQLMPAIEYEHPAKGANDVFPNTKIVVFFNKDMDAGSFHEESFIVSKDEEMIETIPVSISAMDTGSGECRMILMTLRDQDNNEIEFDPDSEYYVTHDQDVSDREGNILSRGYRWNFNTGTERDAESPRVEYAEPGMNIFVKDNRPLVRVKLSEDIIPHDLETRFVIKKIGTVTPLEGELSFLIERNRDGVPERWLIFRPACDLEKNSKYEISLSGLEDLAGNVLVPFASYFRTGAVRVESEAPGYYYHGFGTFGDYGPDQGYLLRTDEGLALIGIVDYGTDISSYIDPLTSGPLSYGKYIRIASKGGGLLSMGLTPVTGMIQQKNFGAPGKMECHVDHVFGRFLLPRPSYWSRMGSEDEILDPVIGSGTPVFEQEAHYSVIYEPVIGMWGGSCLRLYSANRFAGTNYLHPFGSGHIVNTGTMSFWTCLTKSSLVTLSLRIHFGGANNYFEIKDNTIVLFINGVSKHERNFDLVNTGSWHHVYLAWDWDAGLAGGLRLRLFIDGGQYEFSVADTWTMGGYYLAFRISATAGCSANIFLDNLKIWNHVVTEDPSFEWNGGAGRENALHVIYGPDADPEYDYRPKLTGPDGGVGYYYLP